MNQDTMQFDAERFVRRDADGHLYVVDHQIYVNQDLYKAELEKVFKQQWAFVGMEFELPEPGSYKTTQIADVPVVVVRDEDGRLHVYENVCLHRGAKLVRHRSGKAQTLICMYHRWAYDLKGRLVAAPIPGEFTAAFRKEDFRLSELPRVETYAGMIFASYRADIEPLVDYLGDYKPYLDQILDDGKVELIGYQRYHIGANWKLFVENTVDGYHPGLLHTAIMRDAIYQYKTGSGRNHSFRNGHGLLQYRMNPTPEGEWDPERNLTVGLVKSRKEGWDLVSNIFPNVLVLQIGDVLIVRQLIPRGVDQADLITYNLARKGESEALKKHRAWVVSGQFGVAGAASLDDKLAMEAVQECATARYSDTVLLRGKLSERVGDTTCEFSLRGFYEKWVQCLNGS
jgi:phenylpropionate dioxygenase-like ring-hydroxylating dioxygenase large terminal subunit